MAKIEAFHREHGADARLDPHYQKKLEFYEVLFTEKAEAFEELGFFGAEAYRRWERVQNQRDMNGQIHWPSLHLLLVHYLPVPRTMLSFYQELIIELDEIIQNETRSEEKRKEELKKLKQGNG